MIEVPEHFLAVDRRRYELEHWSLGRSAEEIPELLLVKTYSVSVGAKGFRTPAGLYTINTKVKDPDWLMPDSLWVEESLRGTVIPGGDPRNPLIARWLGVTRPEEGVGIHGTAARDSIGSAASHGCIRMLEEDVTELYDVVPKGTLVHIT